MRRIVYLFPSNREKLISDVESGLKPDNLLYGYNHLKRFYEIEEAKVSYGLERLLNLSLFPFVWLFNSRYTKINFGRLLLALPKVRTADIVITCVDSINKAAALIKKMRLFSQPLVCMAGNVMDGTERFPILHSWIWSGADIVVTHSPVDLEKLSKMKIDSRGTMIPIGSDQKYWRTSNEKNRKNLVISIGSDRDRDYKTLLGAAKELPDFSFEIHTSARHAVSLHPPANVKIVTDATSQYSKLVLQKASLVVIPLKETYRAAGQLALLDALLMKKPVILSYTEGTVFAYGLKHGEFVYLISPEDEKLLRLAIETLGVSKSMRLTISTNGYRLAIRYTTTQYAKSLKKLIEKLLSSKVSSAN